MFRTFISFILIFLYFFNLSVSPSQAAASCTATVSPSTLGTSTSVTLTFTVTNSGDSSITEVQIAIPESVSYDITSASATGWSTVSFDSTNATFSGGSISAGSSSTFNVVTSTPSTNSGPDTWTVNFIEGGTSNICDSNPTTSTSSSITPTPTPTPPTVTVTETKTVPSVIVSFDSSKTYKDPPTITGTATDNSSNISSLDYSSDSGTIWNSITLDTKNAKSTTFKFTPNIKNSGTYTLKVRARNSQGNYGFTSTFNLILDRTPPTIKIATDLSTPFTVAPNITGTATDVSGISSVSYSIDGENYLPVDGLSSNGRFEFTPITPDDGTYDLSVKAVDNPGNWKLEIGNWKLTIDRLPPQVGLTLFSLGPLVLDSRTTFLPNLPYKLTLSAIGGPSSIKINDTQLTRIPNSNLWSADISFPAPGDYPLVADSIDSAANRTTRTLSTISVLPPGQVSTPTTISVYYRHPKTQNFVLWDAAPYSQSNPLSTNSNYSLFLPTGTYYLKTFAPGFVPQTTTIFNLTSPSSVTPSLNLRRTDLLHRIFFWLTDLVPYTPASYQLPTNNYQPTPLPPFQLTAGEETYTHFSLRGQPTLVTFLASWSPYTSQQLEFLQKLPTGRMHLLVILPQESETAVSLLKRRGQYSLPLVADPDGTLVTSLNLSFSPTHLFIDRKGTIQKTVTGLLTTEEILDYLKN